MTAPDTLRADHEALRKAVPSLRRKGRAEYGVLAQTFIAAMQTWDHQVADGVPAAVRIETLETTLRAAWPFAREWKYLCQSCDDTGLHIGTCAGDATCGREKPHGAHTFGTPCWCSLGARFRGKPKPSAEDFTQAGRSKPTRMGR